MKGRGRTATSLHIDRDKEWLGYVPGNITVKQNKDNIHKYLTYQYDEKGKPANFKTITKRPEADTEQYPF